MKRKDRYGALRHSDRHSITAATALGVTSCSRHRGDPLHGESTACASNCWRAENPLGELGGDFSVALSGKGGRDGRKFSSQNIGASRSAGAGQRVPQPPRRREFNLIATRWPRQPSSGHQGGQDQRRYLRAHRKRRMEAPSSLVAPPPPAATTQPKKHADGPLGQRGARVASRGSPAPSTRAAPDAVHEPLPGTGFAFDKWATAARGTRAR